MATLIRKFVLLAFAWTVLMPASRANPIPLPVPASMPLEEMAINIGPTGHVSFAGQFTFDYIPDTVDSMLFPMPPENPTNIQVAQDSTPLPWSWSGSLYPTVLPEDPLLPMVSWAGPFPGAGAVFSVNYEHDLIKRPSSWVLFYSLGTGKYFPTYDKITTANFQITLPAPDSLQGIFLDNTPLDPSFYTVSGNNLAITLTSAFGPFTQDLIIELNPLPEPGALWLVGAGLAGLLGGRRPGRAAGGDL